ncbi:MAG: HEPN domain-containing protein [Betaproteobacteria bacterium]|nr:HEPN domain-containing protein [Betaproteobacteria bacterium]
MAIKTPVDRLYNEYSSVIAALVRDEPSLAVAAGDNFRKALVLAAASYFEYQVSTCVLDFVRERTNGNGLVADFVKNKAISRQYHTWFMWGESNANHFFGLFGSQFKQMMTERIKASEDLRVSIRAFLEVGNERNKLVHQDFASYSLEKTLEEIYGLYRQSLLFVDGLATHLRECEPLPS